MALTRRNRNKPTEALENQHMLFGFLFGTFALLTLLWLLLLAIVTPGWSGIGWITAVFQFFQNIVHFFCKEFPRNLIAWSRRHFFLSLILQASLPCGTICFGVLLRRTESQLQERTSPNAVPGTAVRGGSAAAAQAKERLKSLRSACPDDPFGLRSPGIRVQVLNDNLNQQMRRTDPSARTVLGRKQNDYILHWDADGTITIPSSPNQAIQLCLEGGSAWLCGIALDPDTQEYCPVRIELRTGEPVLVTRKSDAGSEQAIRYIITRLGGVSQ